MSTLDIIEKAGSLDVFGLISELPKYICNSYKTKRDKREAEVNNLMSTAVSIAANLKYHSFKVYCPKDPEEFYKYIEDILFELDIKDISVIAREDMLSKFIEKFKVSRIIDVETVNGDGYNADIEQFYSEFECNLRRILKDKTYENDTNYKNVLMELQKVCTDNTDDIKSKLDNLHKVLEDMRDKLQEAVDKGINSTSEIREPIKVIVISMGQYNKQDYDEALDLREHFEGRLIKSAHDWNIVRDKIHAFSQMLKEKAHADIPYILYLSAHLSVAYCLGVCLNGKGSYGINVIQNTQGKPLDWSIDAAKDKAEFADKLFNIKSYPADEQSSDVAVCVSTMANSIYEDTYEFIKANNISVGRIIDFNLGDKGGNRSVDGGTHGWYLASQVRDEIMRRSFKERRGNLHLFMAAPVSIPFFLGQLSFAFKKITLYEHTNSDNEKDLYTSSIFIKDADAIS